jgi:phosphonate transport system ATP-binding protein
MISLKNVSVLYPGTIALHPTNIHFAEGQFTVLLGRSGAGKSTLLRCLNLLNRPSSGKVWVEDLGTLDGRQVIREHRRRTAMIFQQHQLIGRNTALKNVLMGRLGYHSFFRSLFPFSIEEQNIALESLERVGLLLRALERVDNLSGGEQQRVGIARALAQDPRFILADEPVASLDPATAEGVLSLLRKVCRENGITAIVSLHQVALAKEFGERIIGLSAGRIVFDGEPDSLTKVALEAIYHHELQQKYDPGSSYGRKGEAILPQPGTYGNLA